MEVFLAILLLFGAYSLGAASHDGDHSQNAAVPADTGKGQTVHDAAQEAKGTDPIDLVDCAADRHYVIYRDLTRLEVQKDAVDPTPADDCEGPCRDE